MAEAFDVETAELCVSRRHGNDARSAAIYLARRATDEAVGTIGAYFGGVSMAAVSKTVARAESRRPTDSAWDGRLTQLSERLQRSGETPEKLNVKT